MSAKNPTTIMASQNDAKDLDDILAGFKLGCYQYKIFIILGMVLMYSSISPLSYSITTRDPISGCDVPQCQNVTQWDSSLHNNSLFKCSELLMNESEKTIVNDFHMECDEHKSFKVSMVGTINSVGQFFGIMGSGLLSDKYGRKFVIVVGSVLSAILGTLRSFTLDYYGFLVLEFLDSLAASGIYGAAFVLGVELVSPKEREKVSTLMGCFYPVGAALMGVVEYFVLDWRVMLRIVYLPGLLVIGCIWCVPESLQWFQTQNRIQDLTKVLSKMAKENGKTIPSNIIEKLTTHTEAIPSIFSKEYFKKVFSSKKVFLQLMNCSFAWITITLIYYGLSVISSSLELPGNKHFNFVLVNIIEVPAFMASYYFMKYYPRRTTQAASFFFSGISCLIFNLFSKNYWFQLFLFLNSKFAICIAFNNMYLFTTEMFPTEVRMTMMGITSMFGRLGSMIAPQFSSLGSHFGQFVPMLLFGIFSLISGALSFMFPETKNKKSSKNNDNAEFDEVDLKQF